MDAIRRTYDIGIKPMNSEEYWEPSDLIKPIAPRIFRPPGRSRKKRTEASRPPPPPPNNGEKVRRTFQVTYSKCGDKGHYYKTCKGAPSNPNWQPKTKKPRQRNGETNSENIADPNQAKVRKNKKKMPKKPFVPREPEGIQVSQEPQVEIPLSQSAPPIVDPGVMNYSMPPQRLV
ncbi:hypothetical protein PIB30_043675 [Stylosanthes scabra]|uniref:CCHC-type domain-containing protein n=1 Tax=Stylosanthes scabra TaxID=79078 RepID=A0ABU6QF64_9FABA|nr:hypothetical protein [Stylosanthes scabra]